MMRRERPDKWRKERMLRECGKRQCEENAGRDGVKRRQEGVRKRSEEMA